MISQLTLKERETQTYDNNLCRSRWSRCTSPYCHTHCRLSLNTVTRRSHQAESMEHEDLCLKVIDEETSYARRMTRLTFGADITMRLMSLVIEEAGAALATACRPVAEHKIIVSAGLLG